MSGIIGRTCKRLSRALGLVAAALLAGGAGSVLGSCGPFTDTAADGFCPFVLEVFTLAITTGTTRRPIRRMTTNRLQMAAFLSRTVDRSVQRGGQSAALARFWTRARRRLSV